MYFFIDMLVHRFRKGFFPRVDAVNEVDLKGKNPKIKSWIRKKKFWLRNIKNNG